jgi:hypothetical protein
VAFRLACNLRLSTEGRPGDDFLASVPVGPSRVLDDVFVGSADNARRFSFQKSLVWSSNIGATLVSRLADLRTVLPGSSPMKF